jgi:hypothetical protein
MADGAGKVVAWPTRHGGALTWNESNKQSLALILSEIEFVFSIPPSASSITMRRTVEIRQGPTAAKLDSE